jgi:nucleotide-binding universal stress UspA family protein
MEAAVIPGFRNVMLAAVAGEDPRRAIARVGQVLAPGDGTLTVVRVLDEPPDDLPGAIAGDAVVERLRAEVERATRAEVEALADVARAAGHRVQVQLPAGIAFVEIIRAVLAGQHDLVIKVAEPSSGVHHAVFGSIDRHLLRKCPCPLWLADPGYDRPLGRVLAAVDPAPRSAVQAALSRRVLSLAQDLASRSAAQLHVVHAWQVLGDRFLGVSDRLDPETTQLTGETLNYHRRRLDELLEACGLEAGRATIHLVRGPAGEVVPEVARRVDADLVVMGTVGRVGIPGLLIGNTAERILGDLDCSVLALKPAGFVSPVQPVVIAHRA